MQDEPPDLHPLVGITRASDAPRPGEHLTGDQKRHQWTEAAPGKGKLPRDEIVFMRAERRIGLVIDIVLDERHRLVQPQRPHRILNNPIPCTIRGHKIRQGRALRRGIFQMPHIDVDTARIGQKPPVARRLVMTTMVKIEDSSPFDMKNVVANTLRHPGGRMVGTILVHQEAVFRFKSEDTIQHIRWWPVR